MGDLTSKDLDLVHPALLKFAAMLGYRPELRDIVNRSRIDQIMEIAGFIIIRLGIEDEVRKLEEKIKTIQEFRKWMAAHHTKNAARVAVSRLYKLERLMGKDASEVEVEDIDKLDVPDRVKLDLRHALKKYREFLEYKGDYIKTGGEDHRKMRDCNFGRGRVLSMSKKAGV